MDINQKAEQSHELGLRYLRSRHKEVLVAKDEGTRRQKVQAVLLQEEADRLHDQLRQRDGRIQTLTADCDAARHSLAHSRQTCREQEAQLRAHVREQTALRTELRALGGVTQDATKVLTEKLALSRELAVLKPEVDHLRAQLAHHTDVLTAKLALERQLNTVEVELDNARRTAQRTAERQESRDSAAETALRQQVQDLETTLAAMRRTADAQASQRAEMEQQIRGLEAQLELARQATQSNKATDTLKQKVQELSVALADAQHASQRSRQEMETERAEARGLMDVYEQRVVDLKAKLRAVREDLKATRAELATARETASRVAETTKTKKGPAPAPAQRKRRADETGGLESLLQTPGLETKRPLKKRGFDRTIITEKSAFSITPFLNKTATMEDEVEKKEVVHQKEVIEEADEVEVQDSILGTTVTTSIALPADDASMPPPKRRGRPPRDNAEMLVQKTNVPVAVPVSTGEASIEEAADDQENRPPVKMVKMATVAKVAKVKSAAAEPEQKKKKRKILGVSNSTLFDDDDDAGVKPARPTAVPTAAATATTASAAAVKRTSKALGGVGGKRTILGGVRNAFGTGGFSPLKRDRRGVNASFLA